MLRRSNIGMIATHRSEGINGGGANTLLGADANFFLLTNLTAEPVLRTDPDRWPDGGDASYRGTFEYTGDRYGFSAEHLLIGQRFDPQVGYVRRIDFRRSFAEARFSPRPKHRNRVRRVHLPGQHGLRDGRRCDGRAERAGARPVPDRLPEQRSGTRSSSSSDYELVPRPFTISPGVVVPAGGYDYWTVRTAYSLGQQRPISGRLAFGRGTLYGGDRTEASYSGRVAFIPQFAVEPSVSLNWVDLPYGTFSAQLLNSRFIVTPSPRMIISSLVQYNMSARSITSSVRLRWRYRPGSELFVVYSDGHNLLESQTPTGLLNRSIALKITRLLRL